MTNITIIQLKQEECCTEGDRTLIEKDRVGEEEREGEREKVEKEGLENEAEIFSANLPLTSGCPE